MLPTPDVDETVHQLAERIEEIRTICRLHAYPSGDWDDLTGFPLRLSQDPGLRSDIVDIVRSLQGKNLHLPDVLDLLVLAVGGSSVLKHRRELSEQLNLLGSFLAGIGRWPDTSSAPVLAPGEIPENIQKFTRPQPRSVEPAALAPGSIPATTPAPSPAATSAAASKVRLYEAPRPPAPAAHAQEAAPQPEAPVRIAAVAPAPNQQPPSPAEVTGMPEPAAPRSQQRSPVPSAPEDDALPISDISRALARLERGNLELRAHLDSIDQRISRMEPLLESGNPVDPGQPEPEPFHQQPTPTLVHRDQASSPRASLRPEPVPAQPFTSTRSQQQPQREHTNGFRAEHRDDPTLGHPDRSHRTSVAEPQGPSAVLEPKARVPRFSHFAHEDVAVDAATSPHFPVPAPLPLAAAPAPAPAPEVNRLPRGFFGTAPEPDNTSTQLIEDPPRRISLRNLLAFILILVCLAAAAAFFYLRRTAPAVTQPSNPSSTSAPSNSGNPPNEVSSDGPLTSTPTRPSSPTVNTADTRNRNSSQPHSGEQDLGSTNGFRPAGTFVPSSVMDGRLISRPLPDRSRIPAGAASKGVVVMEVNISSTGQVEDIHVLGGNTAMRYPAVEAVRNWRYKPYLVNGRPVEVRTIVRIDLGERSGRSRG